MDVLVPSPLIFWGTDFHGVPPLTDNTAKTSVGEDSVKIRTAVAQQSCKKHKNNTEWPLKYKTSPPLAASGTVKIAAKSLCNVMI